MPSFRTCFRLPSWTRKLSFQEAQPQPNAFVQTVVIFEQPAFTFSEPSSKYFSQHSRSLSSILKTTNFSHLLRHIIAIGQFTPHRRTSRKVTSSRGCRITASTILTPSTQHISWRQLASQRLWAVWCRRDSSTAEGSELPYILLMQLQMLADLANYGLQT